jgi:catechol 2,3-dioxygenase-like lactoylglutathione lyase family enzyme
MTNTMPHGSTADANFSFTKLLVDDLEKTAAFYKSVCGLVEQQRVDATIDGRPISEITFLPTYPGGGSLTLLKFVAAPKPHNDELILGFTTADIEGFVERVKAARGRVTDPIRAMPEHRLRVAFVQDVEGHLIEVVQLD